MDMVLQLTESHLHFDVLRLLVAPCSLLLSLCAMALAIDSPDVVYDHGNTSSSANGLVKATSPSTQRVRV